MASTSHSKRIGDYGLPVEEILADYKVGFISRIASLMGRKEVLSGKAKFGIFGDGKEVPQLAMARVFQRGDWRAGYYRDQTFMFALGASTVRKFFAQLYADTNIDNDPSSGGRQMNSHFASRFIDSRGHWLNQRMLYNTTADASPTASQMPRLLGLGYASKLYRDNPELSDFEKFSKNGHEVGFGTIGNASTSEGLFWETLNACGVLQVPVVISVWDDGYGISVPNQYQTTKQSISEAAAGFQRSGQLAGLEIIRVQGWDYAACLAAYKKATELARQQHIPALIHVTELGQPQGHSTSGSHERYKSAERLEYEASIDCLGRMRAWLLEENLVSEAALEELEQEAERFVQEEKNAAWQEFREPIQAERGQLVALLESMAAEHKPQQQAIKAVVQKLKTAPTLNRRLILAQARRLLLELRQEPDTWRAPLARFVQEYHMENNERYSSYLLSETEQSPVVVEGVPPRYTDKPESIDGRVVIQRIFDHHLAHDPRIFIIGEDIGKLGGVNLEFEGLSEKHGELRVTDTGIREATILGQGIGAAVRGLRPIVDIQYLDYLLYAFQTMSDDLATLHYRTAGGQVAPVIVRTKGHRLEGVWHTGSPMGTIVHGLRGVHVCVPRDMVQAAGMYNTLLQGDDPALVIEVLNGYRVKEQVPENLTSFMVPLGVPEVLEQGSDLTLVTYGACVAVAREALQHLKAVGIEVELIDVRTLLPFDIRGLIGASLRKTQALLIVDEDVPGGASAFMMQQILEEQGGYDHLDALPRTLTSQPHRGSYGSDGDYFSKPNVEDVLEYAYSIMREREPQKYAELRPLGE